MKRIHTRLKLEVVDYSTVFSERNSGIRSNGNSKKT